MTVFMAIPLVQSSEALDEAVLSNVALEDRYHLQADKGWLIDYKGTSIDLSNHLGVTGQEPGVASPVGPTMIVSVSIYYGRGPAEMWEWIKKRLEQ